MKIVALVLAGGGRRRERATRRQLAAVVVAKRLPRRLLRQAVKAPGARQHRRVDHVVQCRCRSISTDSSSALSPCPACRSDNIRRWGPALTELCFSSKRVV